VSGPVFIFCAPLLIFGDTESVGSCFMFCARTLFQRYHGRRLQFSYFALPDSFPVVPRASGPVFMFCLLRLIFGGTEGVRSFFLFLRPRTYFQRYQGRRVPFSCFALSDSFSTILRVSAPIFMFCAPGLISRGTEGGGPVFMFCVPALIFGDTEGVGSRFHVLRSRTHF
jgi:hypothetical protein